MCIVGLTLPSMASPDTLIRNVTVIDVESAATRQLDVLLRGDRIADLRPTGELTPSQDDTVIEASGLYAIPGLWDMHIHLTQTELNDRVFALLVANGVTGVRDTGGELEAVLAARDGANRPGAIAPRVRAAGPILDGPPRAWRGEGSPRSSIEIHTPKQAIEMVDMLASRGVDFIKLYEMLEPEPFRALVDRAHFRDLRVTAHVPLRMTTDQTLDAGLDGIEHLRGMEFDCADDPEGLLAQRIAIIDAHGSPDGGYELRRKVHAEVRPPAFAHQNASRCGALIKRFAERGTWQTPTLHFVAFRTLAFYQRPSWLDSYRYLPAAVREQRLALVKEYADESLYEEWGEQGRWAIDVVRRMHQAGVRLLAGTDSPGFIFTPGFTLHDELEALVLAGVPPLDALRAATVNPARFFGVENSAGTIEPAKIADLVLLEANPLDDISNTRRVAMVVLRGKVLDRTALDALLAPFDALRN
jgi:imidazolonepropionase-like amidohydrolase